MSTFQGVYLCTLIELGVSLLNNLQGVLTERLPLPQVPGRDHDERDVKGDDNQSCGVVYDDDMNKEDTCIPDHVLVSLTSFDQLLLDPRLLGLLLDLPQHGGPVWLAPLVHCK